MEAKDLRQWMERRLKQDAEAIRPTGDEKLIFPRVDVEPGKTARIEAKVTEWAAFKGSLLKVTEGCNPYMEIVSITVGSSEQMAMPGMGVPASMFTGDPEFQVIELAVATRGAVVAITVRNISNKCKAFAAELGGRVLA